MTSTPPVPMPEAPITLRELGRRGKGVGKLCLRSYGCLTYWQRPPPEFLIIGTKRGGTTSMCRYLQQHPNVLPLFPSSKWLPMTQDMKGVHYLDSSFHHGQAWYRSHFPSTARRFVTRATCQTPPITGEASPYYLFHPMAAERARGVVPNAKIVVMLRNPVDRAFSHYKEQRRNGVEHLSFEDALGAEQGRLDGEQARMLRDPYYTSFAHEHQSYVAQGEYAAALEGWLRRFPREQVLILKSEEFYRKPAQSYAEVLRFLGLPQVPLVSANVWNESPRSAMAEGTRRRLEAHFAPHNARLRALVGWENPWG